MRLDDTKEFMSLAHFRDGIYSSKEYFKIQEYRRFRNSYGVFKGNHKELFRKLAKYEKLDLYELTHSKNGKKKLNNYRLEITRCLHNYLTSAFTLIDNSRKQARSLENESFRREYDLKVAESFKNSTAAIFIGDLRRFTQHFKMPHVSPIAIYSRTENNELNTETKLLITTTHLTGFDWTSKSKKFIEDHPKGVEIKVILNEYSDLVANFHKWYEKNLKHLLKNELSYVSKQEKELKKRQTIFNLDRFFASGSTNKDEFEKLLYRHISTYFINRIIDCSKNERVDLIIRSLKNLKVKTKDYKEQIEKLNNQWP